MSDTLEVAARSYAIDALALIRSECEAVGKAIDPKDFESLRRFPWMEWYLGKIPSVLTIIRNASEGISGLSSYAKCIEAINADGEIKPHLEHYIGCIGSGLRPLSAEFIADALLRGLPRDLYDYAPDASRVDDLVATLRRLLRGNEVRLCTTGIIDGVSLESAIRLDEDIDIRPFDLSRMSRMDERWLQHIAADTYFSRSMVCVDRMVPKVELIPEVKDSDSVPTFEKSQFDPSEIHPHRAAARDAIETVQMAISSGSGAHCALLLDFTRPQWPFESCYVDRHDVGWIAKRISITDERQAIAEAWSALEDGGLQGGKSIRMAARRFLYSTERRRAEDRIVDLIVAVEALVGAGEKNGNRSQLFGHDVLGMSDGAG